MPNETVRRFVLLLPLLAASAYCIDLGSDSLKGLKSAAVLIEGLDTADETALGVSEKTLKTDVELKLRLAGLTVEQPPASHEAGLLFVRIDPLRVGPVGGYAASVRLELYQGVNITRGQGIATLAMTWYSSMMVYAPPGRIGADIRQEVRDLADRFLNAYLAANPKGR